MKTLNKAVTMLLAVLAIGSANAATITVVEYYHSGLNHYFSTADAAEIVFMDKAPGWTRSGQSFGVWPTASDGPAGVVPACFYTAPSISATLRLYTVDPGECDALSKFDFTVYRGQPFYAVQPVNGTCPGNLQPVYRGFKSNNPDFNFRYANNLASYQDAADRGWPANGVVMCVAGVSNARKADIYRLLRQATFGATDALVSKVDQMGIAPWVDEQLNAPKSSYPDLPYVPLQPLANCDPQGKPNTDPAVICARDNYTLFPVQTRFLQNALNGEDQLRQRVAFALSQILVTSGTEINHAYGMARYQQIMLDRAFGNYRDLLYDMTLSPVMGRYLDMANSNKPDPARGITANENFARENLQLFTTGLHKLNLDGTVQKDAQGVPIPTYPQSVIEEYARVFTGWTYVSVDGSTARRNNPPNYLSPMVPVESNHDTGSKVLLDGYVQPAGRSAAQDLNDAIDLAFRHPNVGPFICKQLIQKLVGGSPSPAYVARVATVFNNNGGGVRGDLKAVTRAILLDPEARGEIKMTSTYGHLIEPVLLATNLLRGLNGRSDGVYVSRQLSGMGQNLFYSPSVFNYYPPDKVLPTTGSTAPEFAILNSATVFNRANFINNLVMGNGVAADATVTGAIGTFIDWTAFQALANDPPGLVDKLAWTFTAGSLSDSARQIIVSAVGAVSASDSLTRAKTAAYLVLNASQTQVER